MIFPTKSWMDCCGSNGLPSNVFQYCTISFIDPKESSSSFRSLSPYLVIIIRIILSSLLLPTISHNDFETTVVLYYFFSNQI